MLSFMHFRTEKYIIYIKQTADTMRDYSIQSRMNKCLLLAKRVLVWMKLSIVFVSESNFQSIDHRSMLCLFCLSNSSRKHYDRVFLMNIKQALERTSNHHNRQKQNKTKKRKETKLNWTELSWNELSVTITE